MQPEDTPELRALYQGFEEQHLLPLWTQLGDLMPRHPRPKAVPHIWKWAKLLPLAEKSGALVPVGRGGERRAIGLANPGLGGNAYVSPTLWAAIQYLGPRETAPEHRHSQNAFRFVVEGEGVWTVVNGDPVRMSRGDLLLTPGWHFHGHHNDTDKPMAWIDGLDIPFAQQNDVGFFEFGSDRVTDYATPRFFAQRAALVPSGPAPVVGAAGYGQFADRGPSLGTYRPGTHRTASPGGGRAAGNGRTWPRSHSLRQPDHRRRRDADDPLRIPPAAARHANAGAPGSRLVGVSGFSRAAARSLSTV
ncbi:cupin domain-containing protein [Roseibium salinum]|nr:cupin domain-containing protein [Roseibium salinum]